MGGLAETISKNVQRIKDEKRWSYYKLAQVSRIPESTIYGLAYRKQNIDSDTLLRLAEALEVSTDELLGRI